MKQKKKNSARKPPLSFIDKFIYYLLIVGSFIVSLLCVYLWGDLRDVIAFQDNSVIAYHEHSSALLFVLLVGYLEISGIVFFMVQLSEKKPIFGNSKIQYGEVPWDKNYYPLFDPRRKNVTITASEKRFQRHMRFAWGIGLLVAISFSLLSFCGRDCLYRDHSIISYNMVNRQTGDYYSENNYSHLTLYAEHVSIYRGGSYWKYGFSIEMNDGRCFSFSNRDFNWREDRYQDNCLETMLEIKKLFTPGSISIKGEKNIDKVVDYIGLNSEQAQLLHNLFFS